MVEKIKDMKLELKKKLFQSINLYFPKKTEK